MNKTLENVKTENLNTQKNPDSVIERFNFY